MARLAAGGAGPAVWTIRVTARLSTLALLALLLLPPLLTIPPWALPTAPPWAPRPSFVARILLVILRDGLTLPEMVTFYDACG